MAEQLTRSDREKIIELLENKVPDSHVNKIMNQIDVSTTYFAHWDSLFNKPTFGKILIIAMLLFVMFKFMISPIFLGGNTSIDQIRKTMLKEARELWAKPWLINFAASIKVEQPNEWKKEYIVSLKDKKTWDVISKTDVFWEEDALLILSKSWAWSLEKEDDFLTNISNIKINRDQSEIIKKIMLENIEVPKYKTHFESIDYWVDTLLNWN